MWRSKGAWCPEARKGRAPGHRDWLPPEPDSGASLGSPSPRRGREVGYAGRCSRLHRVLTSHSEPAWLGGEAGASNVLGLVMRGRAPCAGGERWPAPSAGKQSPNRCRSPPGLGPVRPPAAAGAHLHKPRAWIQAGVEALIARQAHIPAVDL